MIFVTVGTHEQQFDRLVKCVDDLKAKDIISDDVVIQTGFCTYEPRHCTYKNLFPYKDMAVNIEKARIVITHGGPSSFIAPLQMGKIPIVMPRQKSFGEHVNDHQLDFCKAVSERFGNIIVAETEEELCNAVLNYDDIVKTMPKSVESNNAKFNKNFEEIAASLLRGWGRD